MDWTPIVVALIAATPPSLIGYFAYRTSQLAVKAATAAAVSAASAEASSIATGKTVDGVKTELVEAVRGRAQAEGLATGREEGRVTEKAQAAEVKAALETTPGLAAAVANGGVSVPVTIVQDEPVPVTQTDRPPKK